MSSLSSIDDDEEATSIFFRPVREEDFDAVSALEAASYPPDEAATPEKIRYRMQHAHDFFLVCMRRGLPAIDDEIVGKISPTACIAWAAGLHQRVRVVPVHPGFTNGTVANGDLTHETMSVHDPEGTSSTLCVHSVVVREQDRRKGIALRMLQAYVALVTATAPRIRSIRLLCKPRMRSLYEKAGE